MRVEANAYRGTMATKEAKYKATIEFDEQAEREKKGSYVNFSKITEWCKQRVDSVEKSMSSESASIKALIFTVVDASRPHKIIN